MTTATQPMTEAEATFAESLLIEAVMKETGVDRDIAVQALAEARAEFDSEPVPSDCESDDDAFLRRYTRRRLLIDSELIRVQEQMAAMVRSLEARLAGLDFVNRVRAEALTASRIKGGKSKSIKTPHGTLGFRATPGSVELLPEKGEALMEFCKANIPDALKVRTDIVKTPISEYIKLSGQEVPGVVYHEPRDKFYVK